MSRVYVRAQVSGLDSITWFFTFTEGLDPTSDSWTVQCEIFQATLLGGLAQDEDIPPRPDDNDDDFSPTILLTSVLDSLAKGPKCYHHPL